MRKDNPSLDLDTKFVMKGFPLGIAFRKNEPKLAAKLNEWVTANLKNGKLVEIYGRYHGVKLVPEELAAKSSARLATLATCSAEFRRSAMRAVTRAGSALSSDKW
ncbi:hypothetical protein [Bosea sp. PAMC 26642]|uniref:hypothetical protein n=1 Tax=Bosea sp. (strain PAMC 26642) TaxID=1792307 RepID=UPI0026CEAEC5